MDKETKRFKPKAKTIKNVDKVEEYVESSSDILFRIDAIESKLDDIDSKLAQIDESLGRRCNKLEARLGI